MKKPHQKAIFQTPSGKYDGLIGGIAQLLETARHNAARTVNALMTATYWEIGRRIVEFEQRGAERAEYGEELLGKLSTDLRARFGRHHRGGDALKRGTPPKLAKAAQLARLFCLRSASLS